MDSNERFDQLESLMADMLRRMDQFAASQERIISSQEQIVGSQEHTSGVLDSVVGVLKIIDQRFQRVEDALIASERRQQGVEQRQNAMLNLLQQQTESLTAAFKTLEAHDGRIQKLEDNRAA